MSQYENASLVARTQEMSVEDFQTELQRRWGIVNNLAKTVTESVTDSTLSPQEGFELISQACATMFGYEGFRILRENPLFHISTSVNP